MCWPAQTRLNACLGAQNCPSGRLQPAQRIGNTGKGVHYSVSLKTHPYSLMERTRTRLIAEFDVGLRSNQFKDRGRTLRRILSMGLPVYIPDAEYFFNMILKRIRQRWPYCCHSLCGGKKKILKPHEISYPLQALKRWNHPTRYLISQRVLLH